MLQATEETDRLREERELLGALVEEEPWSTGHGAAKQVGGKQGIKKSGS